MTLPRLSPVLVLLATILGGGLANAKPSAAPCGADFLPLAEGTEWSYEFFVPESIEPAAGLHVIDPDKVHIRVLEVTKKGDSATIKLEESYRKVTTHTQIECSKDGLRVPLESFFFAGQPGGGLGMKLDGLTRKGDSFGLKKGKPLDGYQEFVTTAVRQPTEGSGAILDPARLEVERKAVVLGKQATDSGLGDHTATRIDVRMTARAALDSQAGKPFNMPEVQTAMWFANGVGLVRVESSLGRGWKLTEKKP